MKDLRILFSNDYNSDDLYYEYLNHCKEKGIKSSKENSLGFWRWANKREKANWDRMMRDINCSIYGQIPVVVYGTIGLWNERKEIEADKFPNLESAIKNCCFRCRIIEIVQNHSRIEIKAIHADGVNNYEVCFLNERGIQTKKGDLKNRRYHLTIKEKLA